MRLLRSIINIILFLGFIVGLGACNRGGDRPADPPSNEAVWDQSNWDEKNWQ